MTTKSGTCTASVFKKEGTGKYGQFFIHTLVFTDEQTGEEITGDYMAKTKTQTTFEIGKPATFEYEEKQNGQYTNKTIKPIQQNNFGGKFQKKNTSPENALLAAAYAASAQGIAVSSDQIIVVAEKFLTWIKSKENS